MKPVTIIKHTDIPFVTVSSSIDTLEVSELFGNTIQGEGISTGAPATFLRLTGCTLKCTWCDTLDVWSQGAHYSHDTLLEMIDSSIGIDKFRSSGQRLIVTGGSPLKQQHRVYRFIKRWFDLYGFKPYIEVENECVLSPSDEMLSIVDQWNNSPKLSNSGMKYRARVHHKAIRTMTNISNSWFKFVINGSVEDELELIELLKDTEIPYSKVIVMPEGCDQEQLNLNRELVVNVAVKYGFRFSDRLHITVWNKKTGV